MVATEPRKVTMSYNSLYETKGPSIGDMLPLSSFCCFGLPCHRSCETRFTFRGPSFVIILSWHASVKKVARSIPI